MTQQPRESPAPPPVAVCHITTVHPPFDTRIFHKECLSLSAAGYDVHLVACHPRDETVHGIHIHALPTPSRRMRRILFWPWKAYRKVLAIEPRPALCHFHDPELLPLGVLLRLRGFKVIYDVHENVADHMLHKPYLTPLVRKAMSVAYRLMERLLIRGVATLHVLNTIAEKYPQPREVVRNLPWQVAALPVSAPHARPRLFYVGDVATERGALLMIALAAELFRRGVDFELRIAGPIRESGLEQAMRAAMAAQPGLADRVVLLGWVPFERARQEAVEADLGLCLLEPKPNYLNSLPTKVFEYMAVGLPVVASNFDCWREYVTVTGAGVQVDPGDVPAIATAVERLLADPDERRRMGERGRAAIESEYSWEREEEKLLVFYRRLIGPGAPSAPAAMSAQGGGASQ